MKKIILVSALFTLAACGNGIRVTTSVAPEASFASFKTFRMMATPARRDGRAAPADPMLDNSITNRALRQSIIGAFEAKGYARDAANADFSVAFYASAREKLDVTQWNYGYPGRWSGWRSDQVDVRPFTEGTVIVDVVNTRTQQLVWRGRGISEVSDVPETYSMNVGRTAAAIIKEFPGVRR